MAAVINNICAEMLALCATAAMCVLQYCCGVLCAHVGFRPFAQRAAAGGGRLPRSDDHDVQRGIHGGQRTVPPIGRPCQQGVLEGPGGRVRPRVLSRVFVGVLLRFLWAFRAFVFSFFCVLDVGFFFWF